jgi:hypothetical protein
VTEAIHGSSGMISKQFIGLNSTNNCRINYRRFQFEKGNRGGSSKKQELKLHFASVQCPEI